MNDSAIVEGILMLLLLLFDKSSEVYEISSEMLELGNFAYNRRDDFIKRERSFNFLDFDFWWRLIISFMNSSML